MSTDRTSNGRADADPSATTRRTLLSVLPLTTAWAGAAAVVAVPVVWTIVGAVVERSPEALTFIVVLVLPMLVLALGALLYGFAAGALAGLPDWFLRRRPPNRIGAVGAVVVLTVVVTTTFGSLPVFWGVARDLPLSEWVWLAVIAAVTAAATSGVVARHRRRERRAAVAAPEARPA